MDIAREVLGETVSNLLNHENCHSVDEFLLRYKAVKEANQHTIGEQVRCQFHVTFVTPVVLIDPDSLPPEDY